MTTVAYETFLTEVLPYAHNVPYDVAINAVRNACIEFCDKSHWLVTEPDAQTVLADTTLYDMDYDTGEEPLRLIWVKISDVAVSATMTNEFQVLLRDTPSEKIASGLTMKFAVKPTRTSTSVDMSLYNRWVEGIAAGTLARLYAVPAQPFTDTTAAGVYKGLFNSAISDAKIERQREGTIGPLRVAMRSF